MFVDDYKDLMFSGGKRGNLRYDAGYTAINQTDSSAIPGMNLPHRLISTKVMARLDTDKTFEHPVQVWCQHYENLGWCPRVRMANEEEGTGAVCTFISKQSS